MRKLLFITILGLWGLTIVASAQAPTAAPIWTISPVDRSKVDFSQMPLWAYGVAETPSANDPQAVQGGPNAPPPAPILSAATPQPDAPATLKAGAFPAHEAPVAERWGRWGAAEGFRIVSEMRAADTLIFRVRLAPNGRVAERTVSLIGFRDALDAYRSEIRRYGLLTPVH